MVASFRILKRLKSREERDSSPVCVYGGGGGGGGGGKGEKKISKKGGGREGGMGIMNISNNGGTKLKNASNSFRYPTSSQFVMPLGLYRAFIISLKQVRSAIYRMFQDIEVEDTHTNLTLKW